MSSGFSGQWRRPREENWREVERPSGGGGVGLVSHVPGAQRRRTMSLGDRNPVPSQRDFHAEHRHPNLNCHTPFEVPWGEGSGVSACGILGRPARWWWAARTPSQEQAGTGQQHSCQAGSPRGSPKAPGSSPETPCVQGSCAPVQGWLGPWQWPKAGGEKAKPCVRRSAGQPCWCDQWGDV